jgi:hypothetical protein
MTPPTRRPFVTVVAFAKEMRICAASRRGGGGGGAGALDLGSEPLPVHRIVSAACSLAFVGTASGALCGQTTNGLGAADSTAP